MQRAFLFSTTILAAMLAACTPQSTTDAADTDDTSSMIEDQSGSGMETDDAADAPEAPADDFLNSAAIVPYEAGEREGLSMDSLAGAISGEGFYVSFDSCTYDDSGWQEMNDPLAGIRCGYNYYGSLDENGELAFTGPLEPFGSIFTAPGAVSNDGMTVWGVTFGVRLDGTITDGSDNAIGHIALGDAPETE